MTNTKGMTMPQIDDAELFGNAEDQRAYEDFCANQEAVEKFTLDKPALICRWRMSNKKVPMLNRHIRALSERLVQGEPLTHNMLSWAKQHVEWSLAEGDYTARLALLEEQKSLPWQAVWEMYCQRHDTPAGSQWLDSVRAYEKDVLANRK